MEILFSPYQHSWWEKEKIIKKTKQQLTSRWLKMRKKSGVWAVVPGRWSNESHRLRTSWFLLVEHDVIVLVIVLWAECLSARAAVGFVCVLPEDSFNHKLPLMLLSLPQIFISSHVLRYPFRNKEHTHVPQEIVGGTKIDYSCCAGRSTLWELIWEQSSR